MDQLRSSEQLLRPTALARSMRDVGGHRSAASASRSARLSRMLVVFPLAAAALPTTAHAALYFGSAAAGIAGEVSQGSQVIGSPTRVSYSASDPNGTATISASEINNGTIDAKAANYGSAYGKIYYSFQISGDPDIFVPVRVQAKGSVSAAGNQFSHYGANVALFLTYESALRLEYVSDQVGIGTASGLFNGDLDFDRVFYMRSNTDNFLTLTAAANSTGDLQGLGIASSASAYIDPVFTIDPAFSARFRITGLPLGTVSTGAVPEPATWAMMIVGFGAIGAQMRRRQRTRVSVA